MTIYVTFNEEANRLVDQVQTQIGRQYPHHKEAISNILALWVLDKLLRDWGWRTDFRINQDSYIMSQVLNGGATNLQVETIGKIAYVLVKPRDQILNIPSELDSESVILVAIELDSLRKEARLLRYFSALNGVNLPEQLLIANLQPIEELAEFLLQRQSAAILVQSVEGQVQFSKWLNGVFEAGWQAYEDLVQSQSDLSFLPRRSKLNPGQASIIGAKLIQFRTDDHHIVVIISLTQSNAETIHVKAQVRSVQQPTLTPGLQLILLDEEGQTFEEAQARGEDNWLQLRFSAETRDQFSIKVALGEESFVERFVI